MKFIKIIEKYKKDLVIEQDAQSDVPQPEQKPPSNVVGNPQTDTTSEPSEEGQIDEPASVATMGNLLKKALTIKMNDEDRYKVSQLPEINEKNAAQVIDQIIAIMKTYSADIDIDNNSTTSI